MTEHTVCIYNKLLTKACLKVKQWILQLAEINLEKQTKKLIGLHSHQNLSPV